MSKLGKSNDIEVSEENLNTGNLGDSNKPLNECIPNLIRWVGD